VLQTDNFKRLGVAYFERFVRGIANKNGEKLRSIKLLSEAWNASLLVKYKEQLRKPIP